MKILLISLGCDKNRVDSEYMLGMLQSAGHVIIDDENEAEAIVVNTCCFIHDAKEESINTILEMAELKKTGKLKKLIVTGCLAQRYAEEIHQQIPEVDSVLGTSAYDEILTALKADGFSLHMKNIDNLPMPDAKRIITGENYVSYLKIAEGCGKHCTYCVIPSIRGNYRSVPMERLLEEAKYLAEAGTKELILVAQETTLYGVDLYGEKRLHILLEKLAEIDELKWIRVMYCYPEEIYDELLDTMAGNNKILNYLDIPVQHASDKILKAMGRRTNRAELYSIIGKIREKMPDVALRTSLITGFPGETEEDVEILEEFVKDINFTRLGVFTYSKEEGTPAAKMKNQVPAREKNKRRSRIMKVAKELSFKNGQDMVGKTVQVIIEGYIPDEDIYVGRTYMDAPGIDGSIFVICDEKLMSGDMVNVEITGAEKYDLIGEVSGDEFA
ncbi:MAG: 30S ribosomal protein S12 methylthiotransferase RimO [Lachnospiraceae bacterium]|nr:30S ribosomal protein S12 methylthiotransferase RimO [Lachnospiraceae bacterium]